MIALSQVEKSFDGHRVVGPISLEIAAKATMVLIGPSGCGKSTLLKLMLGLLRPDGGGIEVGGSPLEDHDLGRYRHSLGYVVQQGGLFPHMTARQNATLMAGQLGWEAGRIAARLDALLALTKLKPDLIDRYPAELSGGQRQRVGLVRALFLDPDLLLLDEPLGALDPLIRFELQNDLKEIFDSLHKTVVLVTHDMGEARFFADRIVLLKDGRIAQTGSFEELVDSPQDPFVSRFIEAQRAPA